METSLDGSGDTLMNEAQVTEQLRQFIEKQFPLARKHNVQSDTPLLISGIIDSMGTLDLVGFMEAEFDIVLSDEEMLADNFETLQKMTSFLCRKLESGLTTRSEVA